MAYDNEKLNYGKEHIYIVDLLLTGCFQTAGVGACGATETGDEKCFNTIETCNFTSPPPPSGTGALLAISSVTNSKNFIRFYQSRSPAPIGLVGSTISGIDPIPCLKSVSIAPTKIDLSGGLGVRASVSCTFTDFPHSDISIDKYLDERTYIASDRGTFWTKLRARNPDYQNKELRVLSGFLVDGVFDINNFTTRYYIVDKMTVTNGGCTIVAKDPLKLASSKKAQAPAASTGLLALGINDSVTSAILTPSGVGDLEYPANGKVLIDSEVMLFDRTEDALTLTRAQNNTLKAEHDSNATVQLCLEYDGEQVDFIVNDLLTNYATIDAGFIPNSSWAAEVNAFLPGGLSAIIVKPFDVFKLLKELAESKPHYLWWDENDQVIQLTALKEIGAGSNTLDMDSGIVADSFKTSDRSELRKSTIFVNFGQFDPTKRLDEFSNYQQTYARIDTGSISKYGSNEIKTINSRWITNGNKGAAIELSQLIGRRFSDIPREISFSLEAKDSNVWTGQSVTVNHRDVVDFTGSPVDTVYQILSAKDNVNLKYSALEFTYGDVLDQDTDLGFDNLFIPTQKHYNMRQEYNALFPAGPDANTKAIFFVSAGVIVGSEFIGQYSIATGSWPAGAEITIQTDIGSFIVGLGGGGGDATQFTSDAKDGGHAIKMEHPLTLINNGVIGGGGGGGGGAYFTSIKAAGGGGGAGNNVGIGKVSVGSNGGGLGNVFSTADGTNGTTTQGGFLGFSSDPGPDVARGGNAGDLGMDGETGQTGLTVGAGGDAGDAIHRNSHALTDADGVVYGGVGAEFGDIRGLVT